MNGFVELARFYHAAPMEECLELLTKAGISHRVADNSPTMEIGITGMKPVSSGIVSVPESDLISGRMALLEAAREEVSGGFDPDYYLNSCSDTELEETLANPWENSSFDLALAEVLMKKRGAKTPEINFESANDAARQSTAGLDEGRHSGPRTVFLYAFIAASLGGVFGIIAAWNLVFATETTREGIKRHFYNRRTRFWGWIILAYSILVVVTWALYLSQPWFLLAGTR